MTAVRRASGPAGGGVPVDCAVLYRVALGQTDVSELVEHPREVRAPGSSRAMTSRELATAMQSLAMYSNVFVRSLAPEVADELRAAMYAIYAEGGLVEPLGLTAPAEKQLRVTPSGVRLRFQSGACPTEETH